jgi:ATP-dependent exoDNAse (exonuclease V) beta subunit
MPADHAVRIQALDPARSFIVEAPAGSGKTELLTRRYLRLLSLVGAPEEILAITFTRKAAAEMRNRVLKALSLAEHDTPSVESQRPIWELARAVRSADALNGWRLLENSARLRIMTIDALNSFLARQLPILSGAGAALGIARDADALYVETVLRLVERLSARDAIAEAVERLLRHLDNQYGAFELLLSQELRRREHWLDLGLMRFDLPQLRERLEAALRIAICDELSALAATVPHDVRSELVELAAHAAAVLNSLGMESEIAACDSIREFPEALPEQLVHWRGLAELLLTDKGEWRKKPNKNQGFPPEDKASKQRIESLLARLLREPEMERALHRVRALPAARYDDSQWQILTDLLNVLKLAVAELEIVMRERGEADYVANAIAARRALGSVVDPTDLALRLDYRLQHLLVDEFQDTSRGQVELLALLTAGWSEGDGRTLFCVGDPMQSIYRFRNADVGLFLNLKQHGLNQLRLTPLRLTVNFRSAKPVLAWVNRAFAGALPSQDDPDRGAVAFTSSEPQVLAEVVGGVFVHASAGEGSAAREDEARQIGALIEQTRRSAPAARVAVLVTTRLHLQRVIAELQRRGIPFNAVDIDPLLTRPAVQDLIALTRAVVHLADRTAWLAVLRAPWCGVSLADLHALCAGSDRATVWRLLCDAERMQLVSADGRLRLARLVEVMQRSLRLRGRISLRECVERTWNALGGAAMIANVAGLKDCFAYLERLEAIERSGDLEDVARLEASLEDLYASPGTDPEGAMVELMTIHRAKGLEFDVVILPALDRSVGRDSPWLLRTQELPQLGERALLLAPITARGSELDPIYAWLESLDKERARLEKGRLLYVAATRAVRELHLFGVAAPNGKPRANTFLHSLWPVVEQNFVAAATSTSISDSAIAADHAIRIRRAPVNWRPPEPMRRAVESELRDVAENELLHPEFEWVGETARHVGTLVHREIERISRLAVTSPKTDVSIGDQAHYAIALTELGVPPHLLEAAGTRVREALTRMAGDERGRWLLASDLHRDASSEFAISGVIDGEIVNGVIDRTFIDSNGTRWIVDFKTSTHEGGGREDFLMNEVERYRGQLRRYARLMRGLNPAEPIKAALYFPVLGAWREVGVD